MTLGAILFDADGTLLDIHSSVARHASRLGFKVFQLRRQHGPQEYALDGKVAPIGSLAALPPLV